jgi:hypothetical protein
MMERFSDNARLVVSNSFRHEAVVQLRDVVQALAGRGIAERLLREARVVAAELPVVMIEQHTLVALAEEIAHGGNSKYVGTQHLLLAMASMPGSGLAERGASAERLGELLSAIEFEWQSRPSLIGRFVAWCRSVLRR